MLTRIDLGPTLADIMCLKHLLSWHTLLAACSRLYCLMGCHLQLRISPDFWKDWQMHGKLYVAMEKFHHLGPICFSYLEKCSFCISLRAKIKDIQHMTPFSPLWMKGGCFGCPWRQRSGTQRSILWSVLQNFLVLWRHKIEKTALTQQWNDKVCIFIFYNFSWPPCTWTKASSISRQNWASLKLCHILLCALFIPLVLFVKLCIIGLEKRFKSCSKATVWNLWGVNTA